MHSERYPQFDPRTGVTSQQDRLPPIAPETRGWEDRDGGENPDPRSPAVSPAAQREAIMRQAISGQIGPALERFNMGREPVGGAGADILAQLSRLQGGLLGGREMPQDDSISSQLGRGLHGAGQLMIDIFKPEQAAASRRLALDAIGRRIEIGQLRQQQETLEGAKIGRVVSRMIKIGANLTPSARKEFFLSVIANNPYAAKAFQGIDIRSFDFKDASLAKTFEARSVELTQKISAAKKEGDQGRVKSLEAELQSIQKAEARLRQKETVWDRLSQDVITRLMERGWGPNSAPPKEAVAEAVAFVREQDTLKEKIDVSMVQTELASRRAGRPRTPRLKDFSDRDLERIMIKDEPGLSGEMALTTFDRETKRRQDARRKQETLDARVEEAKRAVDATKVAVGKARREFADAEEKEEEFRQRQVAAVERKGTSAKKEEGKSLRRRRREWLDTLGRGQQLPSKDLAKRKLDEASEAAALADRVLKAATEAAGKALEMQLRRLLPQSGTEPVPTPEGEGVDSFLSRFMLG
jgi:hypothetical protein